MLKDKSRSIVNSIGILKARKQALIKEFLAATLPFLRSREDIKKSYGRAIRELAISIGREGKDSIESLTIATERDFGIEVREKSIWGCAMRWWPKMLPAPCQPTVTSAGICLSTSSPVSRSGSCLSSTATKLVRLESRP